jgi:hypothetical protein
MSRMADDVTPDKREAAETALHTPGTRRKSLLSEIAQAENDLRPLVRQAVKAGVPLRRISDQTGLSVTTVRLWAAGA